MASYQEQPLNSRNSAVVNESGTGNNSDHTQLTSSVSINLNGNSMSGGSNAPFVNKNNNNVEYKTFVVTSSSPSNKNTIVYSTGGSNQYQQNNNNNIVFSSNNISSASNMSKNEPVKIVYPGGGQQSTAVLNMNNSRVTFTNAPIQNGTITISQLNQQQQNQMQQQGIKMTASSMGQNVQQPQTLILKNAGNQQGTIITSSAQGMKTVNNQGLQNISQLPGNLQILNVRPQGQNAQKVGTVGQQPTRLVNVINSQIVRPPNNNTITLQNAIQNLQPGQQGSTLLLKSDNGQFQLLRIGPAPAGGAPGLTQTFGQGGNQTIRLQTVPAQSPHSSQNTIIMNPSITTSTAGQQMLSSQTNPTIVSVSQMPALASSTHVQSTGQHNTNIVQQVQQSSGTSVVVTQQPPQRNDNAKEKCRKFLTNLIELSKREPKNVEKNVRTLIQELVDANVEPEEFCKKLEKLLNASPQPCLIGFLKKSLPLLRQSLVTKEIVIEGINPPTQNFAYSGATITTTQIPAQIRPISGQTIMSTGNIGQTQIRMVTPTTPRIGQTTIRPTTPIRIQNAIQAQRMAGTNITPIRAGQTTIVQTNNLMPALHPVSGTTIMSGTNQIRSAPRLPAHTLQIRQATPMRATLTKVSPTKVVVQGTPAKTIATPHSQLPVKVNNQFQVALSNSNSNSNKANNVAAKVVTSSGQRPLVVNPSAQLPTVTNKPLNDHKKPQNLNAQKQLQREKEKKAMGGQTAVAGASAFFPMYGDDDINDVAAMGGVNLAEESQRILGSTEFVGTQIRSCKDEIFLNLPVLQQRIRAQLAKHGLDEPGSEVGVLVSHACQEHLKSILEKLAVIAEHRIDILKIDPRYEMTNDVRGQIKFLEELDKSEQKRHEEYEREILLRAAKSRSKTEDPEQAKLKAKAKEMQRAEMEELRHREANNTALQAIGPRKKAKLDNEATTSVTTTGVSSGTKASTAPRPRIKRVNMRDMIFYLEQERESHRSSMLYKAYLK